MAVCDWHSVTSDCSNFRLIRFIHRVFGALKIMGRLSIGIQTDFEFLRLPELLLGASQTYPDMRLSFIKGISSNIISDIHKGILDSGFFFGPSSKADLHIIQLAEVETAIVAPISWADKVMHASLEELAPLPWVYTTDRCPFYHLTEELFRKSNLEPNKVVFVETEDAIRELVKAGSGISLLRSDDAERAEVEGWGVRCKDEHPSISLNVAVKSRRVQEPIIQAWFDELSKVWSVDYIGEQYIKAG